MSLDWKFKAACEQISIEWRRKLGNRLAYDPLPASELLDALEISLIALDKLTNLSPEECQHLTELSAAVISVEPIIVLYNPTHSPARHESNMMHECAHIILKHP